MNQEFMLYDYHAPLLLMQVAEQSSITVKEAEKDFVDEGAHCDDDED